MNSKCYRFKLIEHDKGLFDEYIDIVYILTMENSKREKNYMDQIKKYIPHKKILIQYNKGYKTCKKKLIVQDSKTDLCDAYNNVFVHAKKNNYNNIIIFEDDFFFDNTINTSIVDKIGCFIKKNNFHIYHLGPLFSLFIPKIFTLPHRKTFMLLSSHGVIYNKTYFDWYINKYNTGFTSGADGVWNDLSIIKYSYYKPLCFQLCEETENRNTSWGKLCNFINILPEIVKLLKLDKKYQPGFMICNIISFLISLLLFIFIYYCLIKYILS